jgi:2-oxo-hept-3-ene-1,7-dioate hydratase
MALANDTISELAARLHQAEASGKHIRQFSLDHPDMTIDDAYAIQRAWKCLKVQAGRTVRGHKIGLTSRAMQRSSKINEPDFGVLLDDMFYPDGGEIPAARLIVPAVEVELAFVLGRPLKGPDCTLLDVLNATDYVIPAVEIIDKRIDPVDAESGRTRTVRDTISDNAAAAGVVLGGRPVKPFDIDLRWASAICYRNGVIEDSGVAAAVLNHPANGVAWLANKLCNYGEALEPGEVILAGSFTSLVAAKAGDVFHVDYGPLGSISFRFV